MAKGPVKKDPIKRAPAQIKRRISSGMTLPNIDGHETRVLKVGDEVTNEVKKHWEAWQKEANSGGDLNINDYTS